MKAKNSLPLRHRYPGLKRVQRNRLTFYTFLTPWLLGFIFLTVIPLAIGLVISFTNYDGLNWDSLKFVGFNNYSRAFTDPDVGFSLQRTLIWLGLYLPLWIIVSFSLALLLNQDMKGKGFFRVLYYLPTVVPAASAVMVWKAVLDKNNGLLNGSISLYKPGTAIGWLQNYSLQGMASIALWTGLGAGMIIFLAGLQNVPDELLEAAKIDGAGSWGILWNIILPLMTPVIFFQVIVGLIAAFQQLTYPLLLGYNYLYMANTYKQIMQNQRYGYGTAMLWLLFIGIVILTGILFWSQKFWVYTGEAEEEGA